jgi:hypothetical protein
LPITLKPPTAPISLAAVVDLTHVHHDGAIVCTANSFVLATPVAILLVHLDGHCVTGCDGTFACYALGAAGVAAYVVRGHTL